MPCGAWLVVRRSLAAGPGDPHRHDKLKHVQIAGFYPAKSLLELACYSVLETATLLERLELGTTYIVAIMTYIEAKVPSTFFFEQNSPRLGHV